MRNKQVRNVPVNTVVDTREAQGGAPDSGEDIAFYYRTFCSGDAKFCVSTGLTPSLLSTVNVLCDSLSNHSRDAKFCVSQAKMRNKLRRNMPDITAIDTREAQGGAPDSGEDIAWHRVAFCL